jgi:hypothetical protein
MCKIIGTTHSCGHVEYKSYGCPEQYNEQFDYIPKYCPDYVADFVRDESLCETCLLKQRQDILDQFAAFRFPQQQTISHIHQSSKGKQPAPRNSFELAEFKKSAARTEHPRQKAPRVLKNPSEWSKIKQQAKRTQAEIDDKTSGDYHAFKILDLLGELTDEQGHRSKRAKFLKE